jgi:hypothetical protein
MIMNNPMNPIFAPNMGTTSLDLPPALASILSVGSSSPTMQQSSPMSGISSGVGEMENFAPSYQQGGLIGPGGMPAPTRMPSAMPPAQGVGVSSNMQAGTPMDPQMLEMQLNQFVSQNPQQMQQIRQEMMMSMQSGELTQDELNMIIQLATVAAQNPRMYQYVRQFAIQQGIAAEEDLPQEYDQGLIFTILLAGRSLQQSGRGAGIPSMEAGGKVPQSKKDDGSVLINAHEGEYVVPKNVVEMKGREFFDSLVAKYSGDKA